MATSGTIIWLDSESGIELTIEATVPAFSALTTWYVPTLAALSAPTVWYVAVPMAFGPPEGVAGALSVSPSALVASWAVPAPDVLTTLVLSPVPLPLSAVVLPPGVEQPLALDPEAVSAAFTLTIPHAGLPQALDPEPLPWVASLPAPGVGWAVPPSPVAAPWALPTPAVLQPIEATPLPVTASWAVFPVYLTGLVSTLLCDPAAPWRLPAPLLGQVVQPETLAASWVLVSVRQRLGALAGALTLRVSGHEVRHALGHLPLTVSAAWSLVSAEGVGTYFWGTTGPFLSLTTALSALTWTWSGGGGLLERRLFSALAIDGTTDEVLGSVLIHPRAQQWPSRFDGHLTLETQPTVAVWP